jgi:hypothetical protein
MTILPQWFASCWTFRDRQETPLQVDEHSAHWSHSPHFPSMQPELQLCVLQPSICSLSVGEQGVPPLMGACKM